MINPTINTCAAEADVVDWCFSFFHPDRSFNVYLYPVLGVVLTLLFITAGIILLAKKCNSKMKKKVPSMFPHFFVSCFSTCSGYLYAFFSKTLIQTECNIMQMLKYFLFFFFFTIIGLHLSTCINAAILFTQDALKWSYVFTKQHS